jgi:hypothetical protein
MAFAKVQIWDRLDGVVTAGRGRNCSSRQLRHQLSSFFLSITGKRDDP